MFIEICDAIRHAHQKGVIHRDIKPSNIIVATVDGVAIPKVIDFGTAKFVETTDWSDRACQTLAGDVLGTPLYMSPEQAESGSMAIDVRSDIYALGVLLYELLSGDTPLRSSQRCIPRQ